MSNQHSKYTWIRNGSDIQWITWRSHRGFSGQIDHTGNAAYQLTVTGTGAPSPATYQTLKEAKNAFRKFLHGQPVS